MKNKMTKTTITLIACTAAAAFVGSANAAMLSNIGNTWPDSPVLETVTNTQDNNARNLTEARGEFVQSFTTTTAFQIDKIYIEVAGITNNVDFQIRIFEMAADDVNATTFAPNVGNVVLAPITINTGSTANGNVQDVLEIDLVGAEEITLLANQGYGIGISVVDDGDPNTDLSAFGWRWHDHRGATPEIYTAGRAFGNGAGIDFDRTLAFAEVPDSGSSVSLSDFAYNPADGSSSVSIKGAPDTRYQLAEADDLDFSNPDQNPIPLDGATVGVLDGDVVTTDGNGDATVQFNLGTTKPATFIRAEEAPPLLDENFDTAAALPAGWVSSGPNNGTDWEVGVPSGVASGPLAPVSEPNCAGTNIGGYYTENTDVTLTSPSIPIPVATSATLTFKQLIDTDAAGDSGSVRILDADNSDAPIANLEITGLQGLGSSGDGWTTGTLALPALEVGGKNIKVQFRFVSDAGSIQDTDVFGGFYIDDVLLALD